MIRRSGLHSCIVLILVTFGGVAAALAQSATAGPDLTKVRVHFGPLWMNPALSLTNLGVDDNVFNEPDDAPPKKDFTFTLEPMTDLWLRFGPTWFKGTVKEDIVWYQKYASQRSTNNTYGIEWQIPIDRLRVDASNTWLKTSDRPSFEIDARAPRRDTTTAAVVELQVSSQTFVGLRGQREQVDFDPGATFLGTDLSLELNRVGTSAGVTLRHQLTPLTSITFNADREQDRFEFSALRNSNSTSLGGVVTFEPAALIKGTAGFGYRDFEPLAPDLPGYRGATVDVALTYSLFETTKATVAAKRDVQYSFDETEPYYLLTGVDVSLAQQLFGPIDIVGRLGNQHLTYTDRLDTMVGVTNRIDIVDSYGGGIGYHLGRDVRIGLNIDHERRTSPVAERRYHGLRFGAAVTYGS